ncbi:hypothetical protein [Paludisphaera sp.]|uniref:hypothetical protein n=1 Tax=Paludisphaera sp. TaxID=2017432 RepID=UPI00301BCDDF
MACVALLAAWHGPASAAAAKLRRVIRYHEHMVAEARVVADNRLGMTGIALVGAAGHLGRAMMYCYPPLAWLCSTEGPAMQPRKAGASRDQAGGIPTTRMSVHEAGYCLRRAAGEVRSSLEQFRYALAYRRDGIWHDQLSRYYRAASAFHGRLLASRADRLPRSAPELAVLREGLDRTHRALFGTGADLAAEPLRSLIPGWEPIFPGGGLPEVTRLEGDRY